MTTDDLWQQVVSTSALRDRDAYAAAVAAFLGNGREALARLRGALRNGERQIAVSICQNLPEEDRAQLLEELVFLATWDNGMAGAVRRIIGTVAPGHLDQIQRLVDAQLEQGDDETYRRCLELYRELDLGLMKALAMKAAHDGNPLIREVGRDALEWLEPAKRHGE